MAKIEEKTHKIRVHLREIYTAEYEIEVDEDEYKELLDGDSAPLASRDLYRQMQEDCYGIADTSEYSVFDMDLEKPVTDWREG